MRILGISAGYHDSACCLLVDGEIVAAVEEERLSRIKHDRSFPQRAIRFCLGAGGLTIADIDSVAFYEDPGLKLGRQIWTGLLPGASESYRRKLLERATAPSPVQLIRAVFGYDGPIEIVDHHLSHAASSYFFSGFPEAAVLTIDGVGDWPTMTYNRARGTRIERLEQVDFPHSLGLFYSALTSYLGFEVNEGEYKVMGLAPYGQPKYVDRLARTFESAADGQFRLDLRYFSFANPDRMFSEAFAELLGAPARQPREPLAQFHMDVARSGQAVLETMLLEKVRHAHRLVPSDNLCLAGGVALNIVANARCAREGPFKRVFVQPAAGDSGGALGAAAVAFVRRSGSADPPGPLAHVYLGVAESRDRVLSLLECSCAKFRSFRGDEASLLAQTVDRLAAGQVIGWFQGRMEFGPRALGARSILADPRRPEMRDRINALVKKRESFRPFAPAVLLEDCPRHFALSHPSPFMLETCQVTSNIALPAITHVDGSARVQTVDDTTHPRLAGLLKEFRRRTGCPILLNTSFNLQGEPIVATALDAIGCFVRSEIDTLVLEDCVVDRAGISPLWELYAKQTSTRGTRPASRTSQAVYEII